MPDGSPLAQLELMALLVAIVILLVALLRFNVEASKRFYGDRLVRIGAALREMPFWKRTFVHVAAILVLALLFVFGVAHRHPY